MATVTFSTWFTKTDPTGTEVEVTAGELTDLGVGSKDYLFGYAVLRKTNGSGTGSGTMESITLDTAAGSFNVDDDIVTGDLIVIRPIYCNQLAGLGMDSGFTWTPPANTIAMGLQFVLYTTTAEAPGPSKPGDAPGVTFGEIGAFSTGDAFATTSYNNGAIDPTWTIMLFSANVIARTHTGDLTATDVDYGNTPLHEFGATYSGAEPFDAEFDFQTGVAWGNDTFTCEDTWAYDGDPADDGGGGGLTTFNLVDELAAEPEVPPVEAETADLRLRKVTVQELPYLLHTRMLNG